MAGFFSSRHTRPLPGTNAPRLNGGHARRDKLKLFFLHALKLFGRAPAAKLTQDDLNGLAIDRLRELVKATQAEVPGVNVGITGGPVLDYDEMIQSQKDVTLATIVSLVLCALIFIYGYHETGRPIKATSVWSSGWATQWPSRRWRSGI